ncbi:lysozyme inhibitor LprI family protein, partial [Microvirga soli]|uniref:lysozyme inhibitor LprI family protein n=1 Tax=Microvirga soli TaxID=1854496 RepID=UPI00191DB514
SCKIEGGDAPDIPIVSTRSGFFTDDYTTLMKRLDREDQGNLRQAQMAWIAYRDKLCKFETSGLGSVRPTIFAGCLTMLTNEHIKYLDSQLTCEEGDLSCKGRTGNTN